MDYSTQCEKWLLNATDDEDLIKELNEIKFDETKLEDAFYRELEFGTGGLRGVIGAGTNRMNIYNVRKASQGLSNYIINHFPSDKRSIAISYDSRIKSDVFAKAAAEVFAANGIKVYIYAHLSPVPTCSYAVRELGCSAGVMITASHNPSKYNGYKVYGFDGCQITNEAADEILREINRIDCFNDVKKDSFDSLLSVKTIEYISEDVTTKFINRVKEESVLFGEEIDKKVKIIYSPLHGSGLIPVTRILKEAGYENVIVVKEQEEPDGNFTTCPYPNPEIKEAMTLGIEYAKRNDADLLVATDPDCDRVGIAVKDKNGDFVLLSGNETGTLLLNYICEMRTKHSKMPKNPVFIKTIVTTDICEQIAKNYGVRCINVLTGFKYIGEQIALLEKKNSESSYILGFEESYGYCSGTYVRDKDAVNGTYLICEMFSYYKTHGISLLDKLDELYKTYGYYSNFLKSFQFEGSSGFKKMNDIMDMLRTSTKFIGDDVIVAKDDYINGFNGLPKSNVLKFYLESKATIIIRPSGTEPKLKAYISVLGDSKENNQKQIEKLMKNFENLLG